MGFGILGLIKTIAPGIIFYFGLAIIIGLSLKGKVHQALLFVIPLFPLQNVMEKLHGLPLGNQFVDIVLIAMILGWLIKTQSEGGTIFARTPFNKTLVILCIYTYILLWTGSFYLNIAAPLSVTDVRLQAWKNYMLFPLLYFIVVNNIKDIGQIKKLIIAMAIGIIIADYYTVRQIGLTPGLAAREKIQGTFVWLGVNEVAAFFTHYGFVFLGIFLLVKQKAIKILSGLIFVIGIYIVLFLFSRGAYLGVLAGLTAILVIKKKVLIIPLVILLISWQSILPQDVIERIKYTKNEEVGSLDTSSQRRIDMWEKSISLFKENPITGVGFFVFPFLGYDLGDTHNIYMKVLAEQGIIGMILFLSILLLSLKSAWRLYKISKDEFLKGLGLGFLGCIIAAMTTNIFGDRWTYLQLGAYFWIFLALVVRGNMITEETAKIIIMEK